MRNGRESRQGSLSSSHPGSSHGVGAPALTGFGSSDHQFLREPRSTPDPLADLSRTWAGQAVIQMWACFECLGWELHITSSC